jgi:histidyl-tRNA synthetase
MEQQGNAFGKRPGTEVYIVAQDESGSCPEARSTAQTLTHRLRMAGVAAEHDAGDSVKSARGFKAQMKSAGASGAAWLCVVGPAELADKTVTVKNMENGEQSAVPIEDVLRGLGPWKSL